VVATLLVESLFALVFLHALVTYARSRDPLQLGVMLMFSALALIFTLQFGLAVLHWDLPQIVRRSAIASLLAQPVFTLWLVSQIRRLSRWVVVGAIAACLATAVPIAMAQGRTSPIPVIGGVIYYLAAEAVCTVAFVREARRRAGAPQIRLYCAALGSTTMALTIVVIGLAPVLGLSGPRVDTAWRFFALSAAVLYLAAFVTPRWLSRHWSGAAASRVSQQLVDAPATETPYQTWRRYAELVRQIAGADGSVVLLHSSDCQVTEAAAAGHNSLGGTPTARQLDELLAAPQPVRASTLTGLSLGGIRYVTAVELQVAADPRGALILLSRYQMLFGDDDSPLLATLGTQAGILAERGAVLAEQERLTAELATSIEALRRASQAKSDFLATMSHELRTPLNSIIGFSELMRAEDAVGDQRTVPDEWVEHIHSSGRRLLALINDILDLTKVEAGRLELRLEPVDLREAAAQAIAALEPVAARKDLTLVSHTPSLCVHADSVRLRQMLDNLLSNAIKFTPHGGRVMIGGGQAADTGAIWVADTGTGIDEADFERVFDEFQQVGDLTAQKAGTGLGLALTRRLAEAHGGRIELESELGAGSRFTLHLPLAPADDAGADPLASGECSEPGIGGILVIEDEPGAARLLRTYLQSAGYRVRVVRTGEAGLAAARDNPPQAILLDVLLPGMDGWEVLRRLKADPGVAEIPVMIVTVLDEQEAAYALGAVEYLVKPIDRATLLDRLSEHALVPEIVAAASRVLVIDDDPATLQLVEASLRAEGFDVVTAASGPAGLALARAERFELIICDLIMPGVDGYSVIRELEADPDSPRSPIVVFTSHDLSDSEHATLEGRVLGIVRKGEHAQASLHDWLAWVAAARPLTVAGTHIGRARGTATP
jgi:signal transduction histidine kinase/CheY-like chemotaxis protein